MSITTEAAALVSRLAVSYAAAHTVLGLQEAWGSLVAAHDGAHGCWVEHASRPSGAGALVRARWHIAPDGEAHIMALEPGDPRFQGCAPIP